VKPYTKDVIFRPPAKIQAFRNSQMTHTPYVSTNIVEGSLTFKRWFATTIL